MNNDRFKIRCWDSKNKEMYYMRDSNDDFKSLPNISIHSIGYKDKKISLFIIKKAEDEVFTYFSCCHDDLTLMQCTGLKDIDNKDIYEGDVLLYNSPISISNNSKLVVKYGFYECIDLLDDIVDGFGWYMNSMENNNINKLFDTVDYNENDIGYCHKIIGNIYES